MSSNRGFVLVLQAPVEDITIISKVSAIHKYDQTRLVALQEMFYFRTNHESEKIFSITSIVELDIMESLGILVFRTEKCGRDQSQVRREI